MSSYSRMVVIPQEEYVQLTAVQHARQPLTQQFYNAEQDFQRNLHVGDQHRAVMLQSENIERMKELKDKMRSYLTISTPKPYRTRAEALFQTIEPHLNVNDKGEIIKDDNSVIESSRYEDLIQHAVRDRRRNFTPTGWPYFVDLLRKHNVPKSSLNRETLDELYSPTPTITSKNNVRTVSPMKRSHMEDYIKESPTIKKPRLMSTPRMKIKSSPKSTQKRSASKPRRSRVPPQKFMFSQY